MSLDIDDGSKFPDLFKAGLGKSLEDFVKGLMDKDQELFGLAQKTKDKLRKQKDIDLKNFLVSQAGAIDRGNKNSCDARHNFMKVAKDLAKRVKPIVLPSTKRKPATGKRNPGRKLPKTRSGSPSRGAKSRPPSIGRSSVNQSIASAVNSRPYIVQPVSNSSSSAKSTRNVNQFTRAHSGLRGTSIGDRAVVFTANGTPMYGDSYMDKNVAENLAANQATANAPLSQIPSKVKVVAPISANPLQQQPRANVAPKSANVAGMLVLGGIAAAVTAVLFFFQHVLLFVQFILQVSQATATITNIASSFVAILNNIGSLLGLGEDILEPIENTFDSILNNVFGKEKTEYVKFQFAKISGAFVAGQNILGSLGGFKNKLTGLVTRNADNTSKIGNALKTVGMIADTETWMNENNRVNSAASQFKDKLESVSGLSSNLSDITETVKSSKQQIDSTFKSDSEEKKKDDEGETTATEKYSEPDNPDAEAITEPAS